MANAKVEIDRVREVVALLFGAPSSRDFNVRYWDGSEDPCSPAAEPLFAISFNTPGALRRMLLPPNEMSIAEAFLSNAVDIDGRAEQAIRLGDVIAGQLQSAGQFIALIPKIIGLPSDTPEGRNLENTHRFSAGMMRTVRDLRRGGTKAISSAHSALYGPAAFS